ncbi:MAG: GNAT family N-acetyltransferase [Candidatus Micrarchaeota archaeon]
MMIRRAKKEDLEQLFPMWYNSFMTEHRRYDSRLYSMKTRQQCKKIILTHFKSYLRKKDKAFFVAIDNNKIIGYSACQIKKRPPIYKIEKECYFGELAVLRNFRRKGVGTALMSAMKKWAKSRVKLISFRVNIKNEGAIKLYSKMGFKKNWFIMTGWLK